MMKFIWSCLFITYFSVVAYGYDFNNPNVPGETVTYLDELFASASDNYTCSNPNDILIFPRGTGLEGCIRKFVGNNRWPLSCSDAASIIRLECNDPKISSLDGLQQFPNLQTIIFSAKGTEISDISPIRNLTKLHTLIIPNSKIEDIAFLSAISNLRNLDLSRNSVTNLIYFAYLTKLETVALDYQAPNYISDISPIALLPFLRNLSLQGNKITDLTPLSATTNIQYLNIRDNRVADLTPLSNISTLSGINASINMIADITPLTSLINLNTIILNTNRVVDISPLTGLDNISYLSMIGNGVTDVAPTANKRHLRSLSLDYNNITDLTPIHSIMLYANLNELGIAYNCVPQENYELIKYLKDISHIRFFHQCEEFDYTQSVPDFDSVVNKDLVGGDPNAGVDIGGGGSGNTGNSDQISQSAGRGCSISQQNGKLSIDIIYLGAIILLLIKLFIRFKQKSV